MTEASVVVWVGTRADLFPLGPVIEALGRAVGLRVRLVTSSAVAHLVGQLGETGVEVHVLTSELDVDSGSSQAISGGRLGSEFAALLASARPDALVVLGDRWELLYVVPPAVVLGVPVVHLHGGEVTEGAIDDRVRHAVSKLADLHCVSTPEAARRLRQLGESVERIVVTGAPSLDRLTGTVPMSQADLAALLGFPLTRPLALATYHPATAADEDPAEGVEAMLAALLSMTGSVIATHPGLDAGRSVVLARLTAAAARHPSLRVVPSLGVDYPRVMAAADVVVGNSSSGILEAASFSVPVVDVGQRQAGRERGANVITVALEAGPIAEGIRRALSPDFRQLARSTSNPYGDGRSAARIVAVIRRAVDGLPVRKPFVDVTWPTA